MLTSAMRPDVEGDTLPPAWPFDPASLMVDDAVYDVRAVPLSSIAMVTDRVVKVSVICLEASERMTLIATQVNVENIVDVHKLRDLNGAKDALLGVLSEWISLGSIPEVDWKSRLRDLDFQEAVRTRDGIIKRLPTYKCKECPDFEDHVRLNGLSFLPL